MRPVRVLAGLAASALLIAACSSSSTAVPTTQAPAAPVASVAGATSPGGGGAGGASAVTIQNFSFQPASITVSVGSTVTWTNQDSTNHTVTADDGSFDSKAIGQGATFSQTFTKAGTYAYHCAIHPSMKATITVK